MTESSIFRIILAVLLISFMAHRGFYTRKVQHNPESVVKQPQPGKASQAANLIALPAFLGTIIYLLKPIWMGWASFPLPIEMRWLGVGIAAAGFGLLQWAQSTLGKNWSDKPKMVDNQEMIDSGPYQWIRHPIYTAFVLILGSILLISANWFIGTLWIVMTGLDVTARIQVEETMMREQFGEQYQRYMRRTGRLFPRFLKK